MAGDILAHLDMESNNIRDNRLFAIPIHIFWQLNLETVLIAVLVTIYSIATVYYLGRTKLRFAVA